MLDLYTSEPMKISRKSTYSCLQNKFTEVSGRNINKTWSDFNISYSGVQLPVLQIQRIVKKLSKGMILSEEFVQ